DSFQYVVSDGVTDADPATVTVTVLAVNDAPVATSTSTTTTEDTAVDITLTGSDPETDALTVLLWDGASGTSGAVTTAGGGTVTIGATTTDQATATYTPFPDFAGEDSFEFVVNDGTTDSLTVTVGVTVTAVNDAPAADAVTVSTSEDTPVDVALVGTDADGDLVTVLLWDGAQGVTSDVSTVNGGTVAIGATGEDQATATYTPAPDFSGSDTFECIVTDGSADGVPTTVTVTVDAVDDAPTATAPDGPLVVTEGATLDVDLSGTDVDNAALIFTLGDGSDTGTTVNGGLVTITDLDPTDLLATATYVPPSAFDGVDTFDFVVSDGTTTSDPVTVSITVTSLPLLSISDATVVEADGVATLTLALSAASAQAVTVVYDTADDTATSADDYTPAVATTVTIAAGATSATIDVAITSDAINEDDETFSVTLSNATNAALAADVATVTIADDDDITLSISDITVSEADGVAEFVVTASGDTEQVVTVDFVAADATANAPDDYVSSTQETLVLDTATGLLTAQVTLTDDAINEATETFTGSILNATGRGVTIATALATATVLDDDGLSLSVVDVSVAESSGEAAIVITLSQASDQTVTVDYATADATTSSTDYTAASGTVTFAAGSTTETVITSVVDDAVNEDDETFTFTLSNAVGEGVTLALDTATVTIADDDDIVLDLADIAVTETDDGATVVSVPLTLSGETEQTITVDVVTQAVSATDGSDFDAVMGTYTLHPGGTVTFEPSSGEGSVSTTAADVSVFGDSVNEDDETFNLVASSSVGRGVTLGVDTATVTIVDNDDVTLAIDDVTVAEDDASAVATFTVTLSGSSEQAVTVDIDIQGSGDSPATIDADFTVETPQTLTFDAGTTSQTVDVTIADDAVHEGDETYDVVLTNPTGRGVTIADDTGLGTIVDGESLTVEVADASVVEGDGADVTLSFGVTLSGVSEQTITLDLAIAGSATDGATVDADYTAPTDTTVTFAPGETFVTVDLTVLGDTVNEADESIDLTLSNPSDASVTIVDGAAVGLAQDNDDVTVSIASASAAEGDLDTSSLTLDVTLSGASEQAITVDYVATDGTATSGTDYVALVDATLTLAAGETTGVIALTVNGDMANEADETVDMTLSNVTGRGVTLATDTGTATILNDDPLPALAISDATVTEGTDSEATLTVTLTGDTEQTVSVTYATANATASAGDDYVSATGTLTFEVGTTTAAVTVTLVDDVVGELDESFLVNLSGVTNATVSDGQAVVTIVYDDADAALTIVSPTAAQEFVAGTESVEVLVSITNHVGAWRWKVGSDFVASDAFDGELVDADTVTLSG
ncbi:MAG: Calx-beta domain-containing protein, partial [Candidatus Poribacteria bacterium]